MVPDGYAWSHGKIEREKPARLNQPSYANDIAKALWPVPQDYFYVEIRPKKQNLTEDFVKAACVNTDDAGTDNKASPADPGTDPVICGYFKIGHLLQILQQLGKMACTSGNPSDDPNKEDDPCWQSIVGVGSKPSSWAVKSTEFKYPTKNGLKNAYIWLPAHNPGAQFTDKDGNNLGQRDIRVFLLLYKLYQMSLVDTSKLLAGTPPVTISK